jgi:alpha-tubulin suppressor-like RCC1 family protein
MVFLCQFLSYGQVGKVLNFDGTNDQVNLGNSLSAEIDPLNTITVEAWVYPTQLTAYNGCIVGNYAYPTDNGQLQFLLRRDGTSYKFIMNDGIGNKEVSAASSVVLNTWTHVAGVWDGSTIKIYINGILQATTTGVTGSSFATLTNSFVLGFSLAGAPDEAFRGSIDEVRIWSTVRTQTEINNNKSLELILPQTGLLRYYKFNHGIAAGNNAGVTSLTDSSSNANNGTLINFALTGSASNWLGSSPVSSPATHLNFDGSDDYVALTHYERPETMSIEAMVKTSSFGQEQIIGWAHPTNAFTAEFKLDQNKLTYGEWNQSLGSFLKVESIISINDNNWHHVAVVRNGNGSNNVTLYIDGTIASTGTVNHVVSTQTLNIGAYTNATTDQFFNGSIDELRVWNVALTQSEIQNRANCELQGSEPGLVTYYKFNQGNDAENNSGLTALTDSSINANNGTLTNFALNGTTSNWLAGSPVATGSIVPSPAVVTTPVVYNQGDTASALTAITGTNGSGLLWYTSATGGTGATTAPTPTTVSPGNTSYWVSSTNANGCESARVAIVVTVNATITGCWKNIFRGGNQMYAIANNGTLWSWGFNAESQLGLGDATNRNTPTQVGTANNWKDLSSGDRHVIALKEDGTLWAWGRNSNGHLGLGDTSARNTPVQIGTSTDWNKIHCGTNNSLAIKTNGTLWTWGYNNEGQLGLGDTTQRLVPTQVGTDTNWNYVVGTGQGAFAIKTNGTLWGTGANIDGQLGIGDNTLRQSFVQIGTDTNWEKIYGGLGAFTLAIKTNGTLWSTGNGTYGQLGQNSTSSLNIFTQVGTASDWDKIATANSHSMVIKDNGTLWTWGRNNSGQLGFGDSTNRLIPTQVGVLTNWYAITGGDAFLSALNIAGEIWATGNNWAGQLGLGDTTNRNVLVQITCPSVLGTDDFITENKVTIYPNPSNGIFTIVSEEDSAVEVYDMIGKKVLSKNVSIGMSNLDLSNYANGIYLLTVTNQKGSLNTYKIVKQ